MAFPTVVTENESVESTDVSSHDVSLPSGIESGDLLVVFIATDGSGSANITLPAGWNRPAAWTDELNSSGCNFACRYRVADGTEGATLVLITDLGEESAHQSFRIQKGTYRLGNPLESARAEGTSATPDAPNLAASDGQALDRLIFVVYGADNGLDSSAAPTNYASFNYTESSAGAASCSMASARRDLNTASENPGTYTMTGSEDWIAATVIINPADSPLPATTGVFVQMAVERSYA